MGVAMINKIWFLIAVFCLSQQAFGGFPPTTSKVSGDANNVTTFNFQFPNFSGTHTAGNTVSLGVLGIAGGGTGQATANAALNALLPTQTANSGKFLTTDGTNTSWAAAASGSGLSPITKTANYSILTSDTVINGDATSGEFTLTLPTAVGNNGVRFYIKKIDATANGVVIATTSSQTIDGELTQRLLSNVAVTLISDGSNWYVY